jgi:agmatine deiminase
LEPLEHEPTGHVDVFACFTGPDTIVVGQYAAAVDPANAGVLDRNAAILSKVGDGAARLRVVRMAMPGAGDGVCRSYTNAVFANGVVLVPSFGSADAKADQEALDTYRRLLPGRKVVGIDANRIVRREGALRCITLAVPAGRE